MRERVGQSDRSYFSSRPSLVPVTDPARQPNFVAVILSEGACPSRKTPALSEPPSCVQKFPARKKGELPATVVTLRTNAGSFDSAGRFASEPACFAQDDRMEIFISSKKFERSSRQISFLSS